MRRCERPVRLTPGGSFPFIAFAAARFWQNESAYPLSSDIRRMLHYLCPCQSLAETRLFAQGPFIGSSPTSNAPRNDPGDFDFATPSAAASGTCARG